MKLKTQPSKHKYALVTLCNEQYLVEVLYEEIWEPKGDFPEDDIIMVVCGSTKKKTAPKLHIPYSQCIFPKTYLMKEKNGYDK